jgi:hypothetical protein
VLQKKSQGLDSRLLTVEEGVHSVQVASVCQTESQEYEQCLAVLQGHLEGLGSSSEANKNGLG